MKSDMPIGLRFSLLHRAFIRQMDQRLLEKDLTGVQFGVLAALIRLEERGEAELSQRDLENASRVTHPTMTEIIKRLEKKGFLLCRPGQLDRRRKCVSSTEKARSLRREMAELDHSVFRWLCRGMSREQMEQLIGAIDRMLENAAVYRGKGIEENSD